MPLRSCLLRVLLAIALILNGAIPAMATPQAQMSHAQHRTHAMAGMAGHCEHQVAASGMRSDTPSTANTPAPRPAHPAPDCCSNGACHCVCVHQVPSVNPAVLVAVNDGIDLERTQALLPAHASPLLPNLIRPPIG